MADKEESNKRLEKIIAFAELVKPQAEKGSLARHWLHQIILIAKGKRK